MRIEKDGNIKNSNFKVQQFNNNVDRVLDIQGVFHSFFVGGFYMIRVENGKVVAPELSYDGVLSAKILKNYNNLVKNGVI